MSSIFKIIFTSWVAKLICCFLPIKVSITCCSFMSEKEWTGFRRRRSWTWQKVGAQSDERTWNSKQEFADDIVSWHTNSSKRGHAILRINSCTTLEHSPLFDACSIPSMRMRNWPIPLVKTRELFATSHGYLSSGTCSACAFVPRSREDM